MQLHGNGDEVPEFACFEIVHYDSVVVIPVEYHWLIDRYWTQLRSTPTMDRMTTKTDFTGFASTRTAEEGARIALKLATLPDDGPRGGFFDDAGSVAW